MHYDFSTVEDTESFVSVPEGTHVCKIAEVRPATARDGSERWRLRLVVDAGAFAGRTAAWDSITWSERGVYRVKKVLEALGFDVSGQVEIGPDDLIDRRAAVVLETEQWEDPATGRRQLRMRVPYMGYRAPEDLPEVDGNANGGGALQGEEMPF